MRPFIVEFLGTPEAGKTTSVKMLRRSLEEKGYKVGLVRESAEIVICLKQVVPKVTSG